MAFFSGKICFGPSKLISKIDEAIENRQIGIMNEHTKTKLQEVLEFFRDLAIILVVVIFVRTFIAAPFQISGSSMEESYHDGEFILVNKFSYARVDSPSWIDF